MPENDPERERSPIYGTLAPGWEFYRREGARLTEPPHPIAEAYMAKGDNPLAHQSFHRFDKAHQVMLAEEGIVPVEAAAANLRGLREMEAAGVVETRTAGGHFGHAGEAYLIEHHGEETAGWIHVGRSSGDLLALARRYIIRACLLDLMDAALDLADAYCETATEYADAVMPNYTLSQHAQVGTFGWYLMGWERPIERAYERFATVYDRVNQSPAGLAAGTTTDFPINRERTSELLGFDGLVDNAEDGIHADFDIRLEALTATATLSTSIAFAADHLLRWSTQEFALVDLPDRFYGTSSIMPQKRNPYAIQGVQQDAGAVIGSVMEAFAETRDISGRPGAPVAVFERVVAQAEAWETIVRHVGFDRELGEERVYLDWALAADIAGMLVRTCGIPWRWAHQVTAILVRRSIEADRSVRDLTPEHVDAAAEAYLGEPLGIDQADLDEVVDAERAVTARAGIPGSPGPAQVAEQIAAGRTRLGEWRDAVTERRDRLVTADERLDAAVDAVIDAGTDESA